MNILPQQELTSLQSRILPRVQGPGPAARVELVPGQLYVGLVLENPDGTRDIDDRDLRHWGMTTKDLVPLAIENLRVRSPKDCWYGLRAAPGMMVYLAGDGHAAARMLVMRELIQPWPMGGVLVSVPTPDQLLCVPLDRLTQLSAVQVLVQSGHLAHSLGQEPVTDQIFWLQEEEWAHVLVKHFDDSVEVIPPPGFLKIVERLAALELANGPGEA